MTAIVYPFLVFPIKATSEAHHNLFAGTAVKILGDLFTHCVFLTNWISEEEGVLTI
jgi:hypothetical protein